MYILMRGEIHGEDRQAASGGSALFFERGKRPKVVFAGMLEYDGDLKIPKKYLVNPPQISNTLTDFMVKNKLYEYAVSETQKYGHVTYFWKR